MGGADVLADRIARRYDRRGEAHDDLVQVARVGLVNAVTRFDPSVGSEFLSFAVPTMLGEVKRYFRDYSWSVNVPRRLKDLYPALAPATGDLTQRLGRAQPFVRNRRCGHRTGREFGDGRCGRDPDRQ